jgi:hypothetical protein
VADVSFLYRNEMSRRKSTLAVPAVLMALVGVILVGWKSSNHAICSSGQELPGQQSICTASEVIYYAGIVLIVVGVVTLIVALVSTSGRGATNPPSGPVSAPPGWVAHPTKHGWTIWWDGTKYTQERPPTDGSQGD